MNLNLSIIEHELRGHAWSHGLYRAPEELTVEFVERYVGECVFDDAVVYIVPRGTTIIASGNNRAHLICLGCPDEEVLSKHDVMYTEDLVDADVLLNEVSRVFQKYRQWEKEMERIVLDDASIRKIGEVSYPFFNNPIYFMDMHYWVFFFKYVLDDAVPKARWNHYLEHDALREGEYMSLDEIAELRSDQQFDNAIESVGPTIFDGHLVDFRTLYHNTFVNGENVARFCVDEIVHPFDDYDFAITQALGDFLGKHYFSNTQYQVRYRLSNRAILGPLLQGERTPEADISRYLRELGWSFDDTFICLVVDTIPGNDTMLIEETLARHIADQCSCECYTIHDEQFVMVFDLTRQQVRDELYKRVFPTLRDNLLIVGQSMDITGFLNLRYGYIQAAAALKLGRERDASEWRSVFNYYELEYIFNKALEDQPVEMLIPLGLKRLIDADAEKGTHDVDLLRAYLESERDVTKASRKLYMQRSSFYYRLNNVIKPTLNLNLDDGNIRLILIIILRMLNGNDSNE